MKNITGFYCKQPSLLLNTERKGYKIGHRPLHQHHLALLALRKCSRAKPALVLGLERGLDVGKGEKSRGAAQLGTPCSG